MHETVETVNELATPSDTQLKLGVNKRSVARMTFRTVTGSGWDWRRFCYSDPGVTTMDETTTRVLNLFAQMKSDTLDLHTLFEAGGNDPDARGQVLDVVARLVREGLLEERGSDFYKLTIKGRSAIGNR